LFFDNKCGLPEVCVKVLNWDVSKRVRNRKITDNENERWDNKIGDIL
jgi:hypothetical protein